MIPRDTIRTWITPSGLGIEITPLHKPIAPKKEGFRCLSLDSRSRQEIQEALRSSGEISPEAIDRVEETDIRISPSNILEGVRQAGHTPGTFDYILSPHNLEHQPDPVRFFAQCATVLKPGGQLFITMPDRRACFDYYRPFSTLAEILAAYFEKRTRPAMVQIFEHRSLYARIIEASRELTSFPLESVPETVIPRENLREAFRDWEAFAESPDDRYRDAHCWTFSPVSLELILRDLDFLGLLPLEIRTVAPAGETLSETFAQLCRPQARPVPPDPATHYKARAELLRTMLKEEAVRAGSRA